jgi:hypothetical protein
MAAKEHIRRRQGFGGQEDHSAAEHGQNGALLTGWMADSTPFPQKSAKCD